MCPQVYWAQLAVINVMLLHKLKSLKTVFNGIGNSEKCIEFVRFLYLYYKVQLAKLVHIFADVDKHYNLGVVHNGLHAHLLVKVYILMS